MIPFSYLALVEVNSLVTAATSPYNPVLNEWDLTSANNGRYILVEYAPAVAPYRRSRLAGNGTLGDVLDQLTIHVVGATASACVANIEAILGVLDQAARWQRFETVNAIQIRAQVRQGTAGELASVILGPPPGEAPASVSPEFDEAIGQYIIRNVTLRFGRRGAWQSAPPTQYATAGAASQQIQTIAVPSQLAPAPYALAIGANATPAFPYLAGSSRVLFGTSAADFTLIDAESLAVPNLVSTASNLARGGAYASLTGTGAQVQSLVATIPAFSRGDVYLMMNNSAEITVTVQLSDPRYISYSLTGASAGLVALTTTVPSGRSRPVFIGRVDTVTPLTRLWLQLTGPNTAAEVAQIDTIVVHRDVGIGTGSIALDPSAIVPYGATTDRLNPLTIDPGALTQPSPSVYQSERTILFDPFATVSYAGDPYLESVGSTIAVLPLLCAPRESPIITNPNGMFVPQTTLAGGTPVLFVLTARRPATYRVPQ